MGSVICPGCGWTGSIEKLTESDGACPKCSYENGIYPNRLLTLREMLVGDGIYADVYMDLFLRSLFKLLGYPDDYNHWHDYEVVHYTAINGG